MPFLKILLLLVAPAFLAMALLGVMSRRRKPASFQSGQLLACPPRSQNCVSSNPDNANTNSYVAPLQFKQTDTAEDILDKIQSAIEELGGSVTRREDNYLASTFKSKLFGFVDDTEFLLQPDERIVHVRSASRVGRKDFSINAKRIDALRTNLGQHP